MLLAINAFLLKIESIQRLMSIAIHKMEPILASESLDADDELELQPITPDIEHILASMGYQFMYHLPANKMSKAFIIIRCKCQIKAALGLYDSFF